MPDDATATRIGAAEAHATVISHTPAVTAWAVRYFGPWWNAIDTPPADAQDTTSGPVVVAEIDPGRFAEIADRVTGDTHVESVYAGASILVARGEDGSVHALSCKDELAYQTEPGSGRILIVGTQEQPVSTAAARLAREAVRAMLHRDGWSLLHASAAVQDGHALLAFGSKGAGKTTTALLLARYCECELLANDRIFVRAGRDGIQVLPWPAAAAIGLGLLDALGFYDLARERLLAGEQLHPTQDERVTAALRAGHRTPLHEPTGRELKAQVFPDQLHTWFGLPLAASGCAAVLLFPTVAPRAAAARAQGCRSLTEADFFSTTTEDRYPDIFGLDLASPATREQARALASARLARLPHHAVRLGHDVTASAHLLNTIVASV
ncbi:MAG: hypothetical protein ACRDTX_17170 [Pseudonocardiaceae bacterium]